MHDCCNAMMPSTLPLIDVASCFGWKAFSGSVMIIIKMICFASAVAFPQLYDMRTPALQTRGGPA